MLSLHSDMSPMLLQISSRCLRRPRKSVQQIPIFRAELIAELCFAYFFDVAKGVQELLVQDETPLLDIASQISPTPNRVFRKKARQRFHGIEQVLESQNEHASTRKQMRLS